MEVKSDNNDTRLSKLVKRVEKIPALGIWCSVISNALFAISFVMMKAVVKPDNVFAIGTSRMLIQYCVLMPVLTRDSIPFFGIRGERRDLFLGALAYVAYQLSIIVSISFIPAADALVIVGAYPIIVTLVGPCLLREKFHKIYPFNALLTILGVMLINRPTFLFPSVENRQTHMLGFLLAVAAMLSNCGICILSKKLVKTSPWTCSSMYPFATSFGFIVATCVTQQYSLTSCGVDAVLTIFSPVLHSIGAIIYFLSYKYEDAGPLSISGNVESPLVFLMEMVFLARRPPWTTFVGMCLVVIGVVLTALAKWDAGREAVKRRIKNILVGRRKKLRVKEPTVFTISYTKDVTD